MSHFTSKKYLLALAGSAVILSGCQTMSDEEIVSLEEDYVLIDADESLAEQRANLAQNTLGAGFGPQSPRDIDSAAGNNTVVFSTAPAYTDMNLCNIHFHKSAEHKGGEFTTPTKDAKTGLYTGFGYSGTLSNTELSPLEQSICEGKYSSLMPGDTIEVHYVHTTASSTPGPTLGSCLSDININPQFRVETQVMVLVNDSTAANFVALTKVTQENGYYQATNLPMDTGTPVQYAGSTTGPKYNEAGSPLQATWSVRPQVKKVNAASVATWCEGNIFDEDHAHGVRNLVVNPNLLSPIQ